MNELSERGGARPRLSYAGGFRHALDLGELRCEVIGVYATPAISREDCTLILTLKRGRWHWVYSVRLEQARDRARVAEDAGPRLGLDPQQVARDLETLFEAVLEHLDWEREHAAHTR